MSLVFRGIFWAAVYLLVAAAPLLFAWSGPEPGRGFVIDLSVALGFVGLAMMGLQFALVARFRSVAAPFGVDVMLQYHRQMAYVALFFVLAHPLLLFAYDPGKFLPLLNPITAPLRAHFAVLSTLALFALVAFSVWRKRLRMGCELWQLTHGLLAVVVVVAALAHVFLVDYYVDEPWERALRVAMSGAFVWLLVWVRVVRPVQRYRHPWRVEEVVRERGDTYTMVLKPEKENGFAFEAASSPGSWSGARRSPSPSTRSRSPRAPSGRTASPSASRPPATSPRRSAPCGQAPPSTWTARTARSPWTDTRARASCSSARGSASRP